MTSISYFIVRYFSVLTLKYVKVTRAAFISLTVGVLVLALKYLAYYVTGSVSLYSDALESIVNVVAAAAAYFAVQYAARPPDFKHPYGHSKVEYFSAVLEGSLILFAAIQIVHSAWERFVDPVMLEDLEVGLGISLAATVINGFLAAYLVRTGRRQRSPAVTADGQHLWTDVLTTIGVLAGISLAWITGWWWLDPALAIIVAVNIIFVGVRLVRSSVGGLMDESVPDEEMDTIRKAITANMDGAIEVHALRSRHAGAHTFIEFHLVTPNTMTVSESHEICDAIEVALHASVPGSVVTIHVEPENKAKHLGKVVRLGTEN